ncbi:hypothetical protein [Cellulomonas aerilata]|uniref:Calcineurin-like phosphoesterase domain-containing protein n=1 Tax=Cellulomonas aerilata TaxID=515326 RepID=A0A512DGA6_9CELL|nr:hypothetical protein [Cellulomonas aerilata]GEO35220.1 hypothetical protein CAE01nite_29450 [Cellulomonas aerilata]
MPSARHSLAVVAAVVITLVGGTSAHAVDDRTAAQRSARPLTIAVVGDVPYGIEQEASVGSLVDAINHDTHVRLALHVGDIKSGSTTCTDERFAAALAMFRDFKDPVVYTPGDNEWTDCHRVNNGAYQPLERLDAVRRTFFAEPGELLGRRPARAEHQAQLVENVRILESRVAVATLHVVGSDNGLAPWSGLGLSTPTAEQTAEVQARVAATVAWVDETFDAAQEARLRGVVLAMQADTWFPQPTSGQQEIVDRIAARTASFDGEVLLLQGDSHVYLADNPLGLDNFTRIVVHGETLPFEYLRLTVNPVRGPLFTWERVPVAG